MKFIEARQSLGRIIIERLYDALWVHNGSIGYDQFKRELRIFINGSTSFPIDKDFVNFNYNNEKGKPRKPYKYRWETIMKFYIDQQTKANLLQIRKKNGEYGEPCIFMAPQNTIRICERHIFFDLARKIIKEQKKTR